jgi:hypothetical protein
MWCDWIVSGLNLFLCKKTTSSQFHLLHSISFGIYTLWAKQLCYCLMHFLNCGVWNSANASSRFAWCMVLSLNNFFFNAVLYYRKGRSDMLNMVSRDGVGCWSFCCLPEIHVLTNQVGHGFCGSLTHVISFRMLLTDPDEIPSMLVTSWRVVCLFSWESSFTNPHFHLFCSLMDAQAFSIISRSHINFGFGKNHSKTCVLPIICSP